MNQYKKQVGWVVAALLFGLFSGIARADADGDALLSKLKKLRPDLPIERVRPSPVKDIYALELKGGSMLYGTRDARFLFAGDLYQMGDEDLVNLAELRRSVQRKAILDTVKPDDMVIFSPEGETKAVVDVFTDVDCTFCQKLHREVPRMNELGIEVRYLAFPRKGIGSSSYDKMVSTWCAKDPRQALTDSKAGKPIPAKSCDNPVAWEYELGHQVGVTGTPAIVLEDGSLYPGYLPAEKLAQILGL